MQNINKKFANLFFIVLTCLSVTSCKKDFLDIKPKGKLIAEKTADYDLLLNDGNLYIVQPASHILMSDDVAGSDAYFSAIGSGVASLADQKGFRWEDDLYLPADNASEMGSLVRKLYGYNKVINEVMNSTGGSETQKKSLQAEAWAGRAWCFFTMVNYYGKPYNTATSATDPGVPLTLNADITQTIFTRATVKEAYDLIVEDLTKAIPNLPPTVTARIRMSKAAGEALLGKVYVFMGQFDKALPLFNAAISDLSNASITAGLFDLNTEFATGGIFLPINALTGPASLDPATTDRQILYMQRTSNLYKFIFSGAVLTPQASALYQATDLRKKFLTPYPFGAATPYPLGMLRVYGGSYTNMGVSIPDIYLLLAECKSRLGDLAGAAVDMETFRKKRMPAADAPVPVAVAANQVQLTKFILEERIREFAMDGYRWFDMRRLSVDPIYKSTVGTTHNIYGATGTVTATYTLKPERLTFRFAPYIVASNPDMPQNP